MISALLFIAAAVGLLYNLHYCLYCRKYALQLPLRSGSGNTQNSNSSPLQNNIIHNVNHPCEFWIRIGSQYLLCLNPNQEELIASQSSSVT